MRIILITSLLFLPRFLFSQSQIDDLIFEAARRFNLRPLKKIEVKSPYFYQLGARLFEDPILSLNNNISCAQCHNPDLGTSDGLPLGFGEGSVSREGNRFQSQSMVMKRNSPSLFNVADSRSAFWDGRILRNETTSTYITPDSGFQSNQGEYGKLNRLLRSPIAVQALFPIITHAEMRGHKYNSLSNIEIWRKIVARIKASPRYRNLLHKNFSVSDLGNALFEFQAIKFQTPDTNWDKYLAGNVRALSTQEKRGASLFVGKARCVNCHNGPMLSNGAFQNIAAPQIVNLDSQHRDDLGRFEAFNDKRFIYSFKTMPLRNIALTAPYTHSGSLLTLEQVVNHYNNIPDSLMNYRVSPINEKYGAFFNQYFAYVKKGNDLRIARLSPPVRSPLGLSRRERADLVCFLKRSLTQRKYLSSVSTCD